MIVVITAIATDRWLSIPWIIDPVPVLVRSGMLAFVRLILGGGRATYASTLHLQLLPPID